MASSLCFLCGFVEQGKGAGADESEDLPRAGAGTGAGSGKGDFPELWEAGASKTEPASCRK